MNANDLSGKVKDAMRSVASMATKENLERAKNFAKDELNMLKTADGRKAVLGQVKNAFWKMRAGIIEVWKSGTGGKAAVVGGGLLLLLLGSCIFGGGGADYDQIGEKDFAQVFRNINKHRPPVGMAFHYDGKSLVEVYANGPDGVLINNNDDFAYIETSYEYAKGDRVRAGSYVFKGVRSVKDVIGGNEKVTCFAQLSSSDDEYIVEEIARRIREAYEKKQKARREYVARKFTSPCSEEEHFVVVQKSLKDKFEYDIPGYRRIKELSGKGRWLDILNNNGEYSLAEFPDKEELDELINYVLEKNVSHISYRLKDGLRLREFCTSSAAMPTIVDQLSQLEKDLANAQGNDLYFLCIGQNAYEDNTVTLVMDNCSYVRDDEFGHVAFVAPNFFERPSFLFSVDAVRDLVKELKGRGGALNKIDYKTLYGIFSKCASSH